MNHRLSLVSRWVSLAALVAAPLVAAPASIGYFELVRSDPPPVVGQDYYLRHCLMHEKGTHSATNYWRGVLVPINTKVNLVSLSGKTIVLRVESSKETIKVENVPNFTRVDLPTLAARMLSPTPIPLDKFDESMAHAIKAGTMRLGMTKEQVVMARGYPPGHQTASLESDSWKYWSSRFVIQTIVFTDGVLAAGRGIQ